MFKTIANAFRDKEIRKRIFLTLLMLAIFRLGAYIPIPGLDVEAINSNANLDAGSFFGIIATINGTFGSQHFFLWVLCRSLTHSSLCN